MNTRSLLSFIAGAAFTVALAGYANSSKETRNDADTTVADAAAVADPAPAVIEILNDRDIPPADGKLRVLDFNATWCGPCKKFAPNFHAVADKYRGKADFYSIDVDHNPQLAAQYNIQSIPTVVYILPDGTTSSSMGYMDEAQFDNAVAALLK